VATWYDYDLDNDADLFIGSGPANSPGPDYNFLNKLSETGTADLERITTSPIGTDLQNGQIYNFIDYDNDGDQDGFLTNYTGVNDKFFQNDNGVLSSVQKLITTINQGNNLGNTWGDLDNDGFLDVIVTSDGKTSYYRSNGSGDFESVTTPFTLPGSARGAVLADYDNDGDLDLFVSGLPSVRGLFRNDTQNNNKWAEFKLKGTRSNRSGIGAKIKVKAAINGASVWMTREINAQNSFNSHSEFRTHFGLGTATVIDSVIILWPSGQISRYQNAAVNQIYEVSEPVPSGYLKANFTSNKRSEFDSLTVHFKDVSISDSSMPVNSWEWDFDNDGTIDATDQHPQYTFSEPGSYTVALTISNGSTSKSIIKPGFISVFRIPGTPVLTYAEPAVTDTTIPGNGSIIFRVSAVDTTGYELSYQWFRNNTQVSGDTVYNYVSPSPIERTDTIKVTITNQYNSIERVWQVHIDPLTEVEEIEETFDFYLTQNFPNPFNPSTVIQYSLAQEDFVNLTIYNILGEQAAVLVQENQKAGRYNITFDASGLSNGIYFYKLIAGNNVGIKKMIFLK
jgi:PKD repeat protein